MTAQLREQRTVATGSGSAFMTVRQVLLIIGTVVGSFLLLLWLAWFFAQPQRAAGNYDDMLLLMSLVAPSLISFFAILHVRGDMRESIAAALVVSYILLFLNSIILPIGMLTEPEGSGSTLRQTLLTNYTGLMQILIGFYFGSEAVIRAAQSNSVARVASAGAASAANGQQSTVITGTGTTPQATMTTMTTTTQSPAPPATAPPVAAAEPPGAPPRRE